MDLLSPETGRTSREASLRVCVRCGEKGTGAQLQIYPT